MPPDGAVDLNYELDSRYTRRAGRVYLSGVQALVRLPLMQRQIDAAAGLKTGGFISGYRGSPLGGYDRALEGAVQHLKQSDIHFQPGINEDLAATSVWGSQQTGLWPGARVDGVFGIWYGKGPGVDRSGDAIKHANAAGTSRNGGVLALLGDDHGCQSSTLPHQSEQALVAAMVPVLNPSSIEEYFKFGLAGFALSRFSGCWIGFKAVSEVVESSASVDIDPSRYVANVPEDFEMPPGGLNIRWPDPPHDMERRLLGPKMLAVAAFARANKFDDVIWQAPSDRLGIITTGKSYLDVRRALERLGIDAKRAAELGIRLYKVGLTWPLEKTRALAFAKGLEEILVVEEKRSFIEDQLVVALYNNDRRPRVVGKFDETGKKLLSSTGELSPVQVAVALCERIERVFGDHPGLQARLAQLRHLDGASTSAGTSRTPFFCSGCPHNTSTKIPDGSRAMAGIGCHGMAIWQPDRHTETLTHMGGDGANWIGQAPFSGDRHVFQNIGDGTYFHSGSLALRAASAAGVNITYKILFNDAVAMTGGQRHDGPLTVPAIAKQVAAEGARAITVVTDEPEKYAGGNEFPPGVGIRHRDDLDLVQRELREIPGLTVLIYDQTCAAEKRRRRKRGHLPDPAKRVFINAAVCEGCGDCSVKSNCISVAPLDTDFGRKRQIDQSSCNKDYSCLKGFCPSFVTVHEGRLRKSKRTADVEEFTATLADAAPQPLSKEYGILVTGVGGTGVITIGALLGMAAHLEGKGCTVLDATGLAQKNGAVTSHIRLAPSPADLLGVRLHQEEADLVLACDVVVAAGSSALSTIIPGTTRAVVNTYVQPTAAFVANGDIDFGLREMTRAIQIAAGSANVDLVDATGIAKALLGDSIATNLFMLGFAWQKGLVPLSRESLMRAIELNAVAVDLNKKAFAWGRVAAASPAAVEGLVQPRSSSLTAVPRSYDELIRHRAEQLRNYQSAAYADSYLAVIQSVRVAEERTVDGRTGLAEAVARNLYKLMAYKDEYEVARLYTDGQFREAIGSEFEDGYRLELHLAPPLFSRRDPNTGELRKSSYGPWIFPAMKILAHLKWLRNTPFDPFGYTAERKAERQLIKSYVETVQALLPELTAVNHEVAVEIANIPSEIRGFGHVKDRSIASARKKERRLLESFRNAKLKSMELSGVDHRVVSIA